MAQVGYMVARAIVAASLEREPTDSDVDGFLRSTIEGSSDFYGRFARLWPEGIKTASRQRRKLMATALMAFPSVVPDPLRRERIDRVIERLLDDDVALLHRLVDQDRNAPPPRPDSQNCRLYFLYRAAERNGSGWAVPGAALDRPDDHEDVDIARHLLCDETCLANLVGTGCIRLSELGRRFSTDATADGRWFEVLGLHVADLGRAVVDALRDPRTAAGIQADH